MAKIDYTPGIDGATGALSKQGIITRQKIYRDERGRIISYGKQEGYIIAHPRNFKRHPMKDSELPTTPESAPDAQAPIEKNTGAQKRYCQLHAFVRAMIYQQRKANN